MLCIVIYSYHIRVHGVFCICNDNKNPVYCHFSLWQISYLSFCVQNFKTIWQLKLMLWTDEISWDLSLRWSSVGRLISSSLASRTQSTNHEEMFFMVFYLHALHAMQMHTECSWQKISLEKLIAGHRVRHVIHVCLSLRESSSHTVYRLSTIRGIERCCHVGYPS